MGLRQGVGRGLRLAYLASELGSDPGRLGGDPGRLGTRGPGQAIFQSGNRGLQAAQPGPRPARITFARSTRGSNGLVE